jgi:hypothetical protein
MLSGGEPRFDQDPAEFLDIVARVLQRAEFLAVVILHRHQERVRLALTAAVGPGLGHSLAVGGGQSGAQAGKQGQKGTREADAMAGHGIFL